MKKILFIFTLFLFSFYLTAQTLSVKGRWNIKAGYSAYKTHNVDYPLFALGDKLEMGYLRKSNVRVELNYGVLKWLEVGGYFGLMSYKVILEKAFQAFLQGNSNAILVNGSFNVTAILPTFGVNINVHILPFFVKNPKCHWDFYVPVRYGGMYLTKWGDGKYGVTLPKGGVGTWEDVGFLPKWNKYRHEYGAGFGGAVYIKNIIGFYVEALGGQFSYAPEIFRSPYAIRVGLTAKF